MVYIERTIRYIKITTIYGDFDSLHRLKCLRCYIKKAGHNSSDIVKVDTLKGLTPILTHDLQLIYLIIHFN